MLYCGYKPTHICDEYYHMHLKCKWRCEERQWAWHALGMEVIFYVFSSLAALEIIILTTFGAATWWRHQMETFSALLAICAGNSPVSGDFPAQRPVTRSFHVFFYLRLNKRLSKQWWGWWFETLSCSLWRHRNELWGFRWDDDILRLSVNIWISATPFKRDPMSTNWCFLVFSFTFCLVFCIALCVICACS